MHFVASEREWADDEHSPLVCGFAPAGEYHHRAIQGDDEHDVPFPEPASELFDPDVRHKQLHGE